PSHSALPPLPTRRSSDLLLARHYPRVVVLERDVRTDCGDPESAFGIWQRPGVPQFRHSHAFLARLRLVLLTHLPELLDRLRALGDRKSTRLNSSHRTISY